MQCLQDSDQIQVSTVSLSDLQGAHENLVAWMSALDDLTRLSVLRRGQLETVRWFLSKARRERRLVLERIYEEVIPYLSDDLAQSVRDVRTLTHESIRAGSDHIAKWPTAAVEADWGRYCEETRVVYRLWLDAIEAERRALYPLLRQLGAASTTVVV